MPRKVIIQGSPFDRGRHYGQQVADLVRKGVDFYVDMWETSTGRTRGELLDIIGRFAEPIGNFDGDILAEIEGLADGSQLSVPELLVVNGRYEIMLSTVFAAEPQRMAECTSIGADADVTSGGHTILGQNWDWAVPVRDVSIVLEVQQENAPDLITHVEAGFLGHKGLNSEGLALCANAMGSQHDHFDAAVPVWVLARAALNCSSIAEARERLLPAKRAASVNFTMAQDVSESRVTRVASLEVTPVDIAVVDATEGRVSHGNVFADTAAPRGIEDRLATLFPGFCDRARRACELMAQEDVGIYRLKQVLRDHQNRPESICRHREDQQSEPVMETLSSVVMDVTEATFEVADGPPCQTPYVTHRLSRS